jgi:hypothetical protein
MIFGLSLNCDNVADMEISDRTVRRADAVRTGRPTGLLPADAAARAARHRFRRDRSRASTPLAASVERLTIAVLSTP